MILKYRSENVSNLELLAKVRATLRSEPHLGPSFHGSELRIEPDGVLVLAGEVPSVATKKLALVLQIETVTTYIERLKAEPSELDLLFHEFLIGVTEFFRNPEAFDALAQIISNLIADKGPDEQVRIWVPGCATGEEVYSIAIMVREPKDWKTPPKVVIFATDIDAEAVAVARTGRFAKLPPSPFSRALRALVRQRRRQSRRGSACPWNWPPVIRPRSPATSSRVMCRRRRSRA